MARPKQSEPSLSLDRRQLLASAAALSIGTIPRYLKLPPRSRILAQQFPSQKSKIGDCSLERMRRDRSEN